MRSLFILIAIFSMSQVVMADGIKDAETIYGNCLEKAEGITYEMRECAHKHTGNLKHHLNTVWQTLITKHSEDHEMPDEHKSAILSSLQEEQKNGKSMKKSPAATLQTHYCMAQPVSFMPIPAAIWSSRNALKSCYMNFVQAHRPMTLLMSVKQSSKNKTRSIQCVQRDTLPKN